MSNNPNDNPDTFPALGRLLLWVDRPGSANKIFWGLVVASGLLFLADFTYEKYNKIEIENLPGFLGFYGFVSFTAVILLAKALRVFIKRPENFYGDKTIDCEEYPAAGLDKVAHDAD